MRAADGFVAASLWEGLPMSLLEAAACALPAVATDVPGLRDAVRPGETGFLAKAGDSNALAAAMRRLMAAETRAAMGAQARARVEREYSLTAVLDRWERLYEELIAGAAGWKRFP
jgi:glycosyltransferase involved in cell wall biosynthesis